MMAIQNIKTATRRLFMLAVAMCAIAMSVSGQVVRKDSLTRQRNAAMLDEK